MAVVDGQPSAGPAEGPGTIAFTGDTMTWQNVLAAVPERFNNDLMANISHAQGLAREADPVVFAQYFAAVARSVELLRPPIERGETMPTTIDLPVLDAPVGRLHLSIDGFDHRVYYEGQGKVSRCCMRYRGCPGAQWRHVFEVPASQSDFA